jgi:hypothetical protein
MKKYISLILAFLTSYSITAEEVKNVPELNKQMDISSNDCVDVILGKIISQTNIKFCRESSNVERNNDFQVTAKCEKFSVVTVNQYLQVLRANGFVVNVDEKVIHLAAPSVKNIKNNPLDETVEKFNFKGTHKDFISEMAKKFPKSGPFALADFGYEIPVMIDISINETVSLRDVLLILTKKYGIVWSAIIADHDPKSDANFRTFLNF